MKIRVQPILVILYLFQPEIYEYRSYIGINALIMTGSGQINWMTDLIKICHLIFEIPDFDISKPDKYTDIIV